MRSSDGNSDVCSSDLARILGQAVAHVPLVHVEVRGQHLERLAVADGVAVLLVDDLPPALGHVPAVATLVVSDQGVLLAEPLGIPDRPRAVRGRAGQQARRSEEHTSELQSLMRISYAVFCLQKKKKK